MQETWAISGVDLHVDLGGHHVRAGLEDALREAIQSGRLHPGTRLPSSRSLAVDLCIARNTVADVYGQLVAEGWLTARQGSGTHVADRIMAAPDVRAAGRLGTGSPAARVPSSVVPQAARVPAAADSPPGRAAYNLKPGSPDVSAFPRREWLAAARRALMAAPSVVLDYGDPRGLPGLRQTLAQYLARARGVRATADRIVICSGFTQALALLSTALRTHGGAAVAVESLGLDAHRRVIEGAGLQTVPVAVDASGAQTDQLPGADAVLLTPAHQFPTGFALAPDRRTAAVEWARTSGGLVIEDDYDGEFRYDRQSVGALQALDPEHVVYAGTASKSLAPGLRLAWLVLPSSWIDAVVAAKEIADRHTGTVKQLTFAELIASGAFDRHVRRSRLRYRRRRDRLVSMLAQWAPQVRVSGIAAGLHAVLELGDGDTESAAVARAADRGLRLDGLSRYRYEPRDDEHAGTSVEPRHRPALVVGYGTPPDHAFAGALDALCGIASRNDDH
jgi:GntR family transcriptional regulator/MocR family aminotransferase